GHEDNRRQALIRASAKLFKEKGFEATTVRDIAAAVGMRSGSPFYHFANKQEILKAVMEVGLRQGLDRTLAAIRSAETPQERFRLLVRTQYGILHDEDSEFIAVLLYDWRSLPDNYKKDIIALKDEYDRLWHDNLSDMLSLGMIGANSDSDPKAAQDAKITRMMIMGAINFTVTWYKLEMHDQGRMDLDALAERTVKFFMRETAPA
ncbi:MAG: TetR/AcrR family transcriptional regulator, partial [Betaproteobacteria bacterium]|nr:TetR/AcrR family transcriptional regulator [Betaproteobacteria bacterium]